LRIIISGGTGMIGSALVQQLSSSGHELWILTRRSGGRKVAANIELIHWDGSHQGDWTNHVNQADAIINLAGENIGARRWSKERRSQIIESRRIAGATLTEAIRNAKVLPTVFIQASAIGYYGSNNNEILTELSDPGNDFLADVCRIWEASSLPVENQGVRRVVVRTGVVLSKRAGALQRLLIPVNLFIGGPIGSGKQIISWIHLDDEVAAIQFLLENETARGPYNLTAPEPTSNSQLGRAMARIIHRPYWLPVPSIALRMALGEMSSLVLEGQNVIPKKLTEAGFRFNYENIELALGNLL
jgi:uncharacterized protein (TIGR01777 family)